MIKRRPNQPDVLAQTQSDFPDLARAAGYGTVPPKDRCGGSIPSTGTLQSRLTGASLVRRRGRLATTA